MKKFLLFLAVAMVVQNATAQQLPHDPSIRKGQLPNGMTYYIRHNAQTPNVADFYIAQRVGSILEEPRQRGLAHFLEHMAFNGTEHFPGAEKGGLREWCERKGIKFGANLNAYTSVDETVYNISSAPVDKEGVTDTCLLILHDWSHSLLLRDDEIDKERGVIHEEWRTRRSGMAMQRLMEEAQSVIYKGTKYEDCLPIGSMDVVDNFPYQDLRDYYHKWYRPDLQAVIVVGDIDVDQVEQKIKNLFSQIPKPENPAERIYYPVHDNEKMILFQKQDSEQPITLFTLYMKRDAAAREERNTESYYRDGYLGDIVRQVMNDRLRELTEKANAPFISASLRDGSFFLSSTKDATSGFAACKQENVTGSITALVAEMERARQHGFTQSEIDRAKAELLRGMENDYAERDKERNGKYVRQCLGNFTDGEPMLSAGQELQLVKRLDKSVTLADVNRMVREMISDRNQVVTLYGPEKDGFKLPSNEEVEQAILTAHSQTYEAPKEEKVPAKLMPVLPRKGKIVSEKEVSNGYREFTLSNGMRVYARQTDFKADNISMYLFSPGGKNVYPDSDMPSMQYLASVINSSGVAGFSESTLEKMLAGKQVSVSPYLSDETEGMRGSSSVKDFETMLQLTYLYFTSPRRDDEVFQSMMNRQASFLTNRDMSPNVQYNDSVVSILYGNHPRQAPVKKEDLSKVSLDRIMQIYAERFANAGDFSVILTGSMDMKKLRPLLCQYLASLPADSGREQVKDRGVNVRKANERHVFAKKQATPSALTNIYFTAPIAYTADNDLRLDVLCQLMRMVYTEKVREEKGGTYGVSINGTMSQFPADEALVHINFRTDPNKYDDLLPIIYEQLYAMAAHGPEEKDLQKVKEYELKTYGQVTMMNNYWEQVKYKELRYGINFDSDYCNRVKALTTEDIRMLCRELLESNNCIQVTMLPE